MSNVFIDRAIARSEAQKWVNESLQFTSLQTTDATVTTILEIPVDEYSGGFYEIELAAMEQEGTGKYSSKKIIGFIKDTALTLDSPNTLHNLATGTISAATWAAVDVSDNIEIQVTGEAATTINWVVRIKSLITYANPTL